MSTLGPDQLQLQLTHESRNEASSSAFEVRRRYFFWTLFLKKGVQNGGARCRLARRWLGYVRYRKKGKRSGIGKIARRS